MTTVAILEDDEAIRNYLAALIAGSGEFNLAGSFGTAEEAEIFFGNGLGGEVDIMLSDIELPGKNGIDFIARLKPLMPQIQFMVLSSFDDSDRVFGALRAGASGYILKNTPAARLIEALNDLRRGGSPMSSQIARKVVTAFQESKVPEDPKESLSLRERDVLEALAKGFSYKEIASTMFLSVETVRTHIRNIYEKLHVHNRGAALRRAGLR
ncbi:MAG: response regulator transcription factor [Bacteroidetes bacterium]|nr:response regulator transcription factor [Bacteroidota bacterium]MBS1630343.1 response regulator transcription factor [Bacteroidota bacterium]